MPLDSERTGASPSSDISIKSSSSGNRIITFGEHIDQIISQDYNIKSVGNRDIQPNLESTGKNMHPLHSVNRK